MLALLLADGRTPSGGAAHSGGLEAALAGGLSDIPGFMLARLRTIGRVEAAAAVLAAGADTLAELGTLEDKLAARTPSATARDASRRLGLALLRTGRRLFAGHELLEAYDGVRTLRPIALGVVGAAAGLEPLEIARLSLYEDAATVAAAAPKLLAVDAVDASAWVAGCGPAIEALAREAAAIRALPATATPLLDLRAERHANDTRRLFAS
jgi:urease accessory protein